MHKLGIVLVEPQIPQNTGNIARTCAAVGASLHIVRPMGFTITDAKLKRAGLDYWHLLDITYYEDIEDFISRTDGSYFYLSTKGRKLYSEVCYPETSYIIFGREDAGLPEELLLENHSACLRIPMIDAARSLNLSNAVAVCTYEVLRQWGFPSLLAHGRLRGYEWLQSY
ncbi:MAG: tRNA (cytidine(34)-2'-O)-methyltransferase [Oscillospiraceae bacterium]|nr:tRNA (cytidine(34)-2'-O)-methyltransferase [Oscillospiraceae bacterium]